MMAILVRMEIHQAVREATGGCGCVDEKEGRKRKAGAANPHQRLTSCFSHYDDDDDDDGDGNGDACISP